MYHAYPILLAVAHCFRDDGERLAGDEFVLEPGNVLGPIDEDETVASIPLACDDGLDELVDLALLLAASSRLFRTGRSERHCAILPGDSEISRASKKNRFDETTR